MGIREFTKSGKFAAVVFALVVALVPFGLEEIGETTGLFQFRAKKRLADVFTRGRADGASGGGAAARQVDWERYRLDLEEFSRWAEDLRSVVIFTPVEEMVIQVVEEEDKILRHPWRVPVTACTAARGDGGGEGGYVYVSGFDRHFEEGEIIAPSEELCGYEIIFVGERTVWFRAVFDAEGDVPMGVVKLPEFTRVDGECLVRGKRKYYARDAFPLSSGGWLMIGSFMPPGAVVFKILDETRRPVATLLCVVIGEKGGKR